MAVLAYSAAFLLTGQIHHAAGSFARLTCADAQPVLPSIYAPFEMTLMPANYGSFEPFRLKWI